MVSAAFHVLSSAKRTRTPTRDAVAGRRAVRVRASGSDSEATPGTAQREVSIGDGGLDETADGEDDEMLGDIEIPELPKHWMIHDLFLPTHGVGSASSLRGVFDTHHDDPRRTHEYRFVWDYWHVPGQYTLLRTPAGDYFPAADFQQLEFALQKYARAELGCAATTPIWLSCYVEGMRQELHADVPHGPWAFVLSLTNWETRTWSGGETLLLRPETLSYFSNFDSNAVVERGSLTETIEPKFNRLTVFDPRVPHGVPIVEGVRDPKKGRLVLPRLVQGAGAVFSRGSGGGRRRRRNGVESSFKTRKRGQEKPRVRRVGTRNLTPALRNLGTVTAGARHGGVPSVHRA